MAESITPIKLQRDMLVGGNQQARSDAVNRSWARRTVQVPCTAIIEEWRQMHDASSRLVEKYRHSNLYRRDNGTVAHKLVFQVAPHRFGASDTELFERKQRIGRPLAADSENKFVLGVKQALDVLPLA